MLSTCKCYQHSLNRVAYLPKILIYHTLCRDFLQNLSPWGGINPSILTRQAALQSVNIYRDVLQNILAENNVKITISWTVNAQSVFYSMFQAAILPVLEFWKKHICLLWMHSKSGVFGSARHTTKSIGSCLKQ